MELPQIGELFERRYELTELLGEGGFARVYRGVDQSMKREVALKVLLPKHGAYHDLTAARFLREVRLIAELQDPHTLTLYDVGESGDGVLYMVCEYVDGRDLRRVLNDEGPMAPEDVAHVVAQVLRSLREAHSHGIIHRDIKPANILLYEYEGDPLSVKVVDFGLAKPSDADATQLTRQGHSAGTPRYMSPEQVLAQTLGPPSDIYSLGLVAYELLTGKPAVDGDSRRELLRRHVTGPVIELPADSCSADLRAIVDRMLRRELDVRYATADEALHDLTELRGVPLASSIAETVPRRSLPARLADRDDLPPPEPPPEPANRTVVAVAVGVLGLLAFLLIAVLLPTSDDVKDTSEVALPPSVREMPKVSTSASQRGAPVDRDVAQHDADARLDGGALADVRAADACGVERAKFRQEVVVHAGVDTIHAHIRVPKTTYDEDTRYPVIVMFRGRQLRNFYKPDDARDFWKNGGFRGAGLRRGYALVTVEPYNLRHPWESQLDEQYFDRLLAAVAAQYCVDLDRVFLLGHDRGAAVAHRAACLRPVRGLVIWSDLLKSDEPRCTPETAVPVLHIYGRNDRDVPVDGGSSECDPSANDFVGHAEVARRWRTRNGCSAGDGREWTRPPGSEGGACVTYDCETPYVECVLDAGRQVPFPTNSYLNACERDVPAFDIAGATLDFFDEIGGASGRE